MPDVRVKLNEIAATLPKAVRIRLYDRLTFSDLPAHIQRTAPPGVGVPVQVTDTSGVTQARMIQSPRK